MIWVGLTVVPGRFWRIQHGDVPPPPEEWPDIVAVIPARNEAAVIGDTVRSLWAQDYPGHFRLVVVDDHSDDVTAETARQAARGCGQEADLKVLAAEPLALGWTGKVWAMHQGVTRGIPADDCARYILFSDADIFHGEGTLRELVIRAEAGGLDLVSLMVRLQNRTLAVKATHFFRF